MTDTTKLAERIEALEGPCRSIDREIAIASGQYVEAPHRDSLANAETPNQHHYGWPHYTASLDAAMTLVPEGERRFIEQKTFKSGAEGEPERSYARMSVMTDPLQEWSGKAHAATPALALCAAALRAQEAHNG